MRQKATVGVFICRCGDKIASRIDIEQLESRVSRDENVAYCETMAYPCQRPGLDRIMQVVAEKGVNRLIVAGCESRLMMKKFESVLENLELHKGQIDIINLRGHVAMVSNLTPELKAEKGAKLIVAAAAEMAVMAPSLQTLAKVEEPVMIVGKGIASFMAAHELAKSKRRCLVSVETGDPETILAGLHLRYPGEYQHHERLGKIISETVNSPYVKLVTRGELIGLSGITGNYTLGFSSAEGVEPEKYNAGAVIACMDAELSPPPDGFGYDGKKVLFQPEMEECILRSHFPKGQIVFWINDYEAGYPEFAQLSTRSAWSLAKAIRNQSDKPRIIILYNEQMPIPLSVSERTMSRKLGILWVPFDKAVYPTLQDGYISFCNLSDHVEHEIPWDMVVLSPRRRLGENEKQTARILGLLHREDRFLTGHHARVRPDMVGREETYLAGSAKYPCDLHETMRQGRKAGRKTAEMLQKSDNHELYLPRVVCVVDTDRCVGCGQCQELCDCGGISVMQGSGGGLPRAVDPMICMGGGTCAAACPYNALTLQNNTTDQREARVAALARQLRPDEVMALACAWGGLPAADNAANQGLTYDPRIHILGVPCVGQIDPSVLAKAFLAGAPGLMLIGCLPEECHHSFGIDHAWSRVNFMKKLLTLCDIDRRRIALAHADLNKPEEFIRTAESFVQTIAALGPIEKTPEMISKLKSLYSMAKYNSRVRYLLSAGLRRPWEKEFRGDQRHGLDYDQDFSAVLAEEYMQTRVLELLRMEQRRFNLQEIAGRLHEDEEQLGERLWEMVHEGHIKRSYKDHQPLFGLN
ncbi:MAG: hydrogenase iron-sulfur subunit [Thermodesulfobacteriota bacterium]